MTAEHLRAYRAGAEDQRAYKSMRTVSGRVRVDEPFIR